MNNHKLLRCCISAFITVVMIALFLSFTFLSTALALDGSEARNEFSSLELSRLFEECSYNECEFVMHNYDTGKDNYLKVREKYRERYENLVGADEVSIVSVDDRIATTSILSGKPLEQIINSDENPWCDVLSLLPVDEDASYSHPEGGSAFMVSSKIAVTAAHSIYQNGSFNDILTAWSGVGSPSDTGKFTYVSKAVVSRLWIDSASDGENESNADFNHDFALLLFNTIPEQTSGIGCFSYESISILDGLFLSINCTGYIKNYESSGHNLLY